MIDMERKVFDMKKRKSQTTAVVILLIVLLFLVIGAVCALTLLLDRVVPNPPGTIGNSAGNLNNGGYFCEYNGAVYFANAYDANTLYAMDADEGNLKKLSSAVVNNLLAGGKYIYYFQKPSSSKQAAMGGVRIPHAFIRCDLKGRDVTSLTQDVIEIGQLVDNQLYLLAAGEKGPLFYKMSIDKSNRVDLADYRINPACAANGTIYYGGTQDNHYLYALDTTTDKSTVAWQGNLGNPVLDGAYIYYMDIGNNYRICRYSLTQNTVEVLTADRVDCFNVGSGYVYYQKNGRDPQLICMRTDGSDKKVVAAGNFTHINMTSRYVYFQEFGVEYSLYHSPLGSDRAEFFSGAQAAAAAESKGK